MKAVIMRPHVLNTLQRFCDPFSYNETNFCAKVVQPCRFVACPVQCSARQQRPSLCCSVCVLCHAWPPFRIPRTGHKCVILCNWPATLLPLNAAFSWKRNGITPGSGCSGGNLCCGPFCCCRATREYNNWGWIRITSYCHVRNPGTGLQEAPSLLFRFIRFLVGRVCWSWMEWRMWIVGRMNYNC